MLHVFFCLISFIIFWPTKHGIGVPSLMVIMHETLKLLHYAEAEDVRFFRIGTSGGLGMTMVSLFCSIYICFGKWFCVLNNFRCVVFSMNCCALFFEGFNFTSFMVDAYTPGGLLFTCKEDKIQLSSYLRHCHLPFTSPRGCGVGRGRLEVYLLHYVRCCKWYWVHWSVSSVFSPRFGAWNSCHNNKSSQCSFGTIQWAGTVTRYKIAALMKFKKWAFAHIWLPLKAKGISVQISVNVLKLKM